MGPTPNAGRPTALPGRPPEPPDRPARGSRACTPSLVAGARIIESRALTAPEYIAPQRTDGHSAGRGRHSAERGRSASSPGARCPCHNRGDDDPAWPAAHSRPTSASVERSARPGQGPAPGAAARTDQVAPSHQPRPRPAAHRQARDDPGCRRARRRRRVRRRRGAGNGRDEPERDVLRVRRRGDGHADPGADRPDDLRRPDAGLARRAVHQRRHRGPRRHGAGRDGRQHRAPDPGLPRPQGPAPAGRSRRSRSRTAPRPSSRSS